MANMNARDTARWAKEMILECLDSDLQLMEEYGTFLGDQIDMDERQALLKERDRVATFFGLPKRGVR
jgi:hypothetical protein